MIDSPWRECVVVGVLSLTLVRMNGHLRGKTWDVGGLHWSGALNIQLLLTVPCLASLAAYFWNPLLISAFYLPLADSVRAAGLVVFALGVAGIAWCQSALGRHFSPVLRCTPEHELITTGPYRFVRHPMYTAILIASTGLLFITANALTGGTWIVCTLFVMVIRTPAEERMLRQRFGVLYHAYSASTPAFLFLPAPKLPKALGEHLRNALHPAFRQRSFGLRSLLPRRRAGQ